ncbi:hypothetical protein AVEN_121491-1 [Araneus ventricosus]|uniref:Uncharacterized protein n=1 Tax=Araneus ventricosus TaxID=182803 RepID=A0A4Y2K762_ARAVE|nr:hypothetical protein AVEN_121491-1 [Araneus ventricosus]
MSFSVLVTVLAKKTFSYRRVPLFVRFMTVKLNYKKERKKRLLYPFLSRTSPFLHKGMQFLPSFWGLPKPTKNLRVLRLDFAPKSCPVPIARGFVRWLQHSGETSVNDRKVKGSGLDRDLSTVPTVLRAVVIPYASWVGIRPPAVRLVEL